jgi:hypothetical protein
MCCRAELPPSPKRGGVDAAHAAHPIHPAEVAHVVVALSRWPSAGCIGTGRIGTIRRRKSMSTRRKPGEGTVPT